MALPKQVQAQLDEVEALEKEMTARTEKPKAAKSKDEAPTEDQADTVVDAPDTQNVQDAAPETAKPADTPPTDLEETFEQKYRTLQGKYDAEVPRLHQQIRDLKARVDEMAEKAKRPSEPEQPEKSKERVSLVTDADREEFGEELIDVQRRVAREVSQEYEDRMEAQAKLIEELRASIQNTGNQVGQMTFAQELKGLVPDFEQIDNDERWVQWLNEYDPMLRGPRRDQAQAAFNAGDAKAIADYVSLFKQSISDTQKPAEDRRQAELEKQVAPNRTANSQSARSTGKEAKIYSQREVEAGWNKIRVLNTKGQTDAAAKLEAELTVAYLEGRVQA